MYKTIEARVNTVAIPTTGKSCSLYRELLKPLWVIYQQRLKEFLLQCEAISSIGYRIYQQLELQQYSPQPVQFVPIIMLQCIHSIPFWLAWAEVECTVNVNVLNRQMNHFKSVLQSRQQALRPHCPRIYTLQFRLMTTEIDTYMNKQIFEVGCFRTLLRFFAKMTSF